MAQSSLWIQPFGMGFTVGCANCFQSHPDDSKQRSEKIKYFEGHSPPHNFEMSGPEFGGARYATRPWRSVHTLPSGRWYTLRVFFIYPNIRAL